MATTSLTSKPLTQRQTAGGTAQDLSMMADVEESEADLPHRSSQTAPSHAVKRGLLMLGRDETRAPRILWLGVRSSYECQAQTGAWHKCRRGCALTMFQART